MTEETILRIIDINARAKHPVNSWNAKLLREDVVFLLDAIQNMTTSRENNEPRNNPSATELKSMPTDPKRS